MPEQHRVMALPTDDGDACVFVLRRDPDGRDTIVTFWLVRRGWRFEQRLENRLRKAGERAVRQGT